MNLILTMAILLHQSDTNKGLRIGKQFCNFVNTRNEVVVDSCVVVIRIKKIGGIN